MTEKQPEIELFDGSVDELDDLAQQPPATPATDKQEPMISADLDDDDADPVGDGQEDAPADDEDLAAVDEPLEDAADEPEADAEEEEAAADELEDDETASDDEQTEEVELTAEEQSSLEALQTEIAEWRTANDVPHTAEAYEIPEAAAAFAESPLLQEMLSEFFDQNVPNATVSKILERYAAEAAKLASGNSGRDIGDAERLKKELQRDWAGDYKSNIDVVKGLLADEALPEGLSHAILHARDPSGSRLVNNRGFLELLTEIAAGRSKYGLLPAERKAAIEKTMADDMNTYWSQGLDKEYTKLIAAERDGSSPELLSKDARRVAEIEKIMKTDMDEYWRQGLDREYGELIARRSTRRRAG